MPGEVRTYTDIVRWMYDIFADMDWEKQDQKWARMIGLMEIDCARIPPAWYGRILTAVKSGYTTTQKGGAMTLAAIILRHAPGGRLFLSYIGRKEVLLRFPAGAPLMEYTMNLNALWILDSGDRKGPFRVTQSYGVDVVYASIGGTQTERRNGKKNPPKAMFPKVRHLMVEQMREHLHVRQPVLDWLKTKPTIKLPFASHDKNWEYRVNSK